MVLRAIRLTDRALRLFGAALAAAVIVLAVLTFVLEGAFGADDALLVPAATTWLTAGAVLVWRRPAHVISWLMLGGVALLVLAEFSWQYVTYAVETNPGALPAVRLVAFFNWGFVGYLATVGVLLPLLFPTGRPVGERWGWIAWGCLFALALLAIPYGIELATYGGELTMAGLESNSVGGSDVVALLTATAFSLLLVLVLGAFASLVVRFRRSTRIERLQLKWFLFAVSILIAAWMVEFTVAGPAALVLVVAGTAAIPVAIVVAVLRYRLFDIDRIVSRTVSWALVSAVLAGIYVGGVIGLGSVARSVWGESSGAVPVAVSTLLVAGAFGPARRRIQGVVDRRFNRSRYDGQRAVEELVVRLRREVDLGALGSEVTAVASRTVEPTVASVWIAGAES